MPEVHALVDTAIAIRPLESADLDGGFLQLLEQFRPVNLDRLETIAVYNWRKRNGVRTLIAEAGLKVVGTCTWWVEQKFIHSGGKVAHVEDVVVDRDFRGKGVGSKLLRNMLEEARHDGCYKAILHCDPDLERFYRSLGFERSSAGMRLDL